MCIFVAPVIRVSKTRILVAPLADNKQLIVYENQVTNNGKNAMILPVPAGTEPIFVDVSRIDVWDACVECMPRPEQSPSFGGGFGGASQMSMQQLAVQRVGGYHCSVVPTLQDFSRLSQQHFSSVPANITQVLETNYGVGFHFVVCVFDGTVAAHPIAYISSRLAGGKLFIPTRHAHGAPIAHCDGCGVGPILTNRWKCSTCPDFDFCNDCYQKKTPHVNGHYFMHMPDGGAAATTAPPNPAIRQGFSVVEASRVFNFIGQFGAIAQKTLDHSDPDAFDHTIYLLNCVLLAFPDAYSSSQSAITLRPLAQLTGLVPSGPARSLEEVTITGSFANCDYTCVPLEEMK